MDDDKLNDEEVKQLFLDAGRRWWLNRDLATTQVEYNGP
jgi:hypothetical protein